MTRTRQHALVALVAAVVAVAHGQMGQSSCECIQNALTLGLDTYLDAQNNLLYTPPGSSQTYTFPASYGSGGCKTHDNGLEPYCREANAPSWCAVPWCYVDVNACTGVANVQTRYFGAVENLYFSYGTCVGSGSSTGSDYQWTADDVHGAKEIIQLVEDYARGARWQIENTYADINSSATCDAGGTGMCACSDCSFWSDWNSKVLFTQVGMLEGPTGDYTERATATCLSQDVATTYKQTAAMEADPDFARVGYQYFADQATGTYTQWPRQEVEEMCDGDYDPRVRPWYAAGATGPKDVIIVVDVSGSMTTDDRHVMAKAAVKAVLNTLTWKDFATIILFNNAISEIYSNTLVPMTDTNRANMQGWCDGVSWARGGTSFKAPMQKAFDVIRQSVSGGTTSMCQKAIMFLTDGKAEFLDADFQMVQENSLTYDVVIFSYALGSGADMDIAKRLACENKGVFYEVPDNADLSHIMSSYYDYFAHGQEMCSASWVKYTSVGLGHELYAGCMAMYDRTVPAPELLGVSCMDANLFTEMSEMKTDPGWNYFKCVASDMTKMCRQVDLTDCHRQKIRRAYSQSSVCEAKYSDYQDVTSDTVCPCTDQSCIDDLDFTDALNYFCDTWVGDDCNNPDPSWGYTAADMREVREKCPRSCGLCQWSSGACTRTSSEECPTLPIPTECRACLGKVSGVDIDGSPMTCPPDAPRDLMSTTTTPCPSDAQGKCLMSTYTNWAPRRSPAGFLPAAAAAPLAFAAAGLAAAAAAA